MTPKEGLEGGVTLETVDVRIITVFFLDTLLNILANTVKSRFVRSCVGDGAPDVPLIRSPYRMVKPQQIDISKIMDGNGIIIL